MLSATVSCSRCTGAAVHTRGRISWEAALWGFTEHTASSLPGGAWMDWNEPFRSRIGPWGIWCLVRNKRASERSKTNKQTNRQTDRERHYHANAPILYQVMQVTVPPLLCRVLRKWLFLNLIILATENQPPLWTVLSASTGGSIVLASVVLQRNGSLCRPWGLAVLRLRLQVSQNSRKGIRTLFLVTLFIWKLSQALWCFQDVQDVQLLTELLYGKLDIYWAKSPSWEILSHSEFTSI